MDMPRRGYPHHCVDVDVRYSKHVQAFGRRSMEDFSRACRKGGRLVFLLGSNEHAH
jgi:hypothetical protein